MHLSHWLVVLLLCLVAPAARSAESAIPYESLKQGDEVTDAVRIGRRVIVLPPGRWRLVSRSERPVSPQGLVKLGNIVSLSFDEILDGRFNRALDVSATPQSSSINWIDEPCKDQGDSFWIEDRKQGINNQFCIRVGFAHGVVDEARGPAYESWAREIKNKGIGYSREMPFILATKYTRSDFLRIRLQFDPAISGIPNGSEAGRPLNAWNPGNVLPGSKHRQFYDAIRTWAPTFASAIARNFDADESLRSMDFSSPSLPPK